MRGRDQTFASLLAASSLLACCGCAAIWQEGPLPEGKPPVVRLDASWHAERPSKDQVERLAQQRQRHIEQVLQQRHSGVVGLSLDHAAEKAQLEQRTQSPRNATTAAAGSRFVLTGKEQTSVSAERPTGAREDPSEDESGLTLKWKEASTP